MSAIALVPLSYFLLWKTSFGLRLRSTGESPVAAESLGVNVYVMKYWGVLLSGGFAGLGGGFLAIVAANHYQENQVGGRGYIGLAAMLFGNWRPGGLLAGSALFGFADALQLRDSAAIHALILLIIAFHHE
jgi:simple sugar transport system permease protein